MTWQIISFAETTCERLAHTRFRKRGIPQDCQRLHRDQLG